MTKRSHGLFVGRTRHLARHHKPSQLSVSTFIKRFEVGDKVAVVPKGNFRNIPHPRYRGKVGTILAKRGDAYTISVRIQRADVELTVPAVHLEKLEAAAEKKKAQKA